ncbi:hypothetical protein Clacol_003453 [Clathrus columnatus]|uniref:Uncharacterized protein n=1 Tax=Clathrus columnatus TaxID=1419009 RepID=A0AAV5A9L3_9AGAM|nr:hypothetical protein Clacol_003453 [Clathrus columnatus]
MARIFWTFASGVLFVAFVLQFITSISLPFLPALDIVHVNFDDTGGKVVVQSVEPVGSVEVLIQGPTNGQTERVQGSWTNGLAVHPVGFNVNPIVHYLFSNRHRIHSIPTFIDYPSRHLTLPDVRRNDRIAALVSYLAALLTLISFAIDIALLVLVQNAVGNLNDISAKTHFGAGFWLTLVSLILTFIGGSTVCFGRHRVRKARAAADAEKKMVETTVTPNEKVPFWKRPLRFRRSKDQTGPSGRLSSIIGLQMIVLELCLEASEEVNQGLKRSECFRKCQLDGTSGEVLTMTEWNNVRSGFPPKFGLQNLLTSVRGSQNEIISLARNGRTNCETKNCLRPWSHLRSGTSGYSRAEYYPHPEKAGLDNGYYGLLSAISYGYSLMISYARVSERNKEHFLSSHEYDDQISALSKESRLQPTKNSIRSKPELRIILFFGL